MNLFELNNWVWRSNLNRALGFSDEADIPPKNRWMISVLPKNLDLMFPVLLIGLGEILLFFGNTTIAAFVNVINLLLILYLLKVYKNRVNLALMLVPLFRIVNLATTFFFSTVVYSYLFVYGLMLIPIYLIIKSRTFNYAEIGLTINGNIAYLEATILLGIILGWAESRILYNQAIIQYLGSTELFKLSIIVVLLISFVEEFIFRSAIQTAMEERLGPNKGLMATSILFGIMYSNYSILTEILLGICAGFAIGAFFQKGRSLPHIVLAHGIANIIVLIGIAHI